MSNVATTPVNRPQTLAPVLGWWSPNGTPPITDLARIRKALGQIHRPVTLVNHDGKIALGEGGVSLLARESEAPGALPITGFAAACPIINLGDPTFCADYRIQYPYVTGSMANGIASADIVEAMGRAGMLGFFGAAGLSLPTVEAAIDRISKSLGDLPWGFNLIHSPNEGELEAGVVDLYLRRGVKLIEASAYLALTLPVVRYRVKGIHRDAQGKVVTPNRIIAKVSRVEVATRFFSPPPEKYLAELVRTGEITEEQAKMAAEIPMAQDLTAEADSGGHTDNRPAISLLPTMITLRDRLQAQFNYSMPLRVGAAGGISTPASAVAAFAMGAAYVMTGSINQSCVESGSSDNVRKVLAQAEQADTAMAPAADMFEMGVKVQVLKRGTMFPMRATKLFELYRAHASLDAIPANERKVVETQYLRATFEEAWQSTRDFFLKRDPKQVQTAEQDPKHKMALVFRSYLGLSSRWANAGEPSRVLDYQIWCGPAMGAFNEWVRGTFLEEPKNRKVVTVALNILYATAVIQRINTLRAQGIRLPAACVSSCPMELDALKDVLTK